MDRPLALAKQIRWTNPHAHILVDVKDRDGQLFSTRNGARHRQQSILYWMDPQSCNTNRIKWLK